MIVRGSIIIALLAMILATPSVVNMTREQALAATVVPATNPGSVVPSAFRDNKAWSQERGWHWVTLSYDGTQRFSGAGYDYSVGKPLPVATFIATRVRSLSASDPCSDCALVSSDTQGPPSVLGGPSNPALTAAYAHLDNGPREQIEDPTSHARRWTKGAWYLNYSPDSRTFFSWTWIPDDGSADNATADAEMSTAVMPSLSAVGAINLTQSVPAGSRVFPLAGGYRLTQSFGCVAYNGGYPSPNFCPANAPSFHDGVDLAAPAGTPIVAAASGTVTFAGIDSTVSGNSTIVIDHDGSSAGYETVYLHWEKAFVKTGDHVNAGQVIAAVGSVGYSTGPHLHFSVRIAATNQTIDPLAWLAGSVQLATASTSVAPAFAGVMQWQSLIVEAAAKYQVPAGLIAAIMSVESGGNPNAVSPAGAIGLMQIMPEQLTRLGVPQDKWADPASNIDAGTRYLAETLSNGGTLQQAAARYFGSGCDALGTCTQGYVARVLTLYVYFATWIETGSAPTLTSPIPAVASPQVPVTTTTAINTPAPDATTGGTTTSTTTATPTPTSATTPTSGTQSTNSSTQPTATQTPQTSSTTTPSPSATDNSDANQQPSSTATPTPTATASSASTPTATATPTPTATAEPVQQVPPESAPAPTSTPVDTGTPASSATPPPDPSPTLYETGQSNSQVTGSSTPEPAQQTGDTGSNATPTAVTPVDSSSKSPTPDSSTATPSPAPSPGP